MVGDNSLAANDGRSLAASPPAPRPHILGRSLYARGDKPRAEVSCVTRKTTSDQRQAVFQQSASPWPVSARLRRHFASKSDDRRRVPGLQGGKAHQAAGASYTRRLAQTSDRLSDPPGRVIGGNGRLGWTRQGCHAPGRLVWMPAGHGLCRILPALHHFRPSTEAYRRHAARPPRAGGQERTIHC